MRKQFWCQEPEDNGFHANLGVLRGFEGFCAHFFEALGQLAFIFTPFCISSFESIENWIWVKTNILDLNTKHIEFYFLDIEFLNIWFEFKYIALDTRPENISRFFCLRPLKKMSLSPLLRAPLLFNLLRTVIEMILLKNFDLTDCGSLCFEVALKL